MNKKQLMLTSAMSMVLALANQSVNARDLGEDGQCYGIAKAGENACATNTHSCSGKGLKDMDPNDWKFRPRVICQEMNGTSFVPLKNGSIDIDPSLHSKSE